jgi:hypothetical protein
MRSAGSDTPAPYWPPMTPVMAGGLTIRAWQVRQGTAD